MRARERGLGERDVGAVDRGRHAPRGSGKEETSKTPLYRVEALAKGLRVLTVFAESRQALPLKEIAERAGLPKPTAFRLVETLRAEGYIERVGDGLLRPGPAVLTLGFAALQSMDLVAASETSLRELGDRTGQTVNLAVLIADQVLYLQRMRNTDLVTANIQVGSRLPAVQTSIGKVILASLDDDELAKRLGPSSFAGRWGPNAVRSLPVLMKQLALTRERGFATQDEEISYGVRSIAAPVRDSYGRVVAGVNIAVQSGEWTVDSTVRTFRDQLIKTCDQISLRLGRTVNPSPDS